VCVCVFLRAPETVRRPVHVRVLLRAPEAGTGSQQPQRCPGMKRPRGSVGRAMGTASSSSANDPQGSEEQEEEEEKKDSRGSADQEGAPRQVVEFPRKLSRQEKRQLRDGMRGKEFQEHGAVVSTFRRRRCASGQTLSGVTSVESRAGARSGRRGWRPRGTRACGSPWRSAPPPTGWARCGEGLPACGGRREGSWAGGGTTGWSPPSRY